MTTVIDGTTGVTFPAGGIGNPTSSVVGITDTQNVTNKAISGSTIYLVSGQAAVVPLRFSDGSLTTTALSGALEYDSKLPYFTPQGTQRGIIPAGQFYRLNSANAGANATGAQSLFNVGVTLSASTVYAFEGYVMLIKSVGANPHTVSYGFGGTATVNNAAFGGVASTNASSIAPINTNVFSGYTLSLASTAFTTSLATATIWTALKFQGTVSVNAAGTFIPQYTLSAAPGGAYTVQIGSYINIYPVGTSGANTSVGAWA